MIVKRTQFISFPLSGHHWLMRMLRANLGSLISYANQIEERTLENDTRLNAHMQTDVAGTVKINPRLQYIIQYRKDLEAAIKSGFEVCQCGEYERYRTRRLQQYAQWQEKWLHVRASNRLIIAYEDMVENPSRELARAYKFLTGTDPLILVVEMPRPGQGHYEET